MRPCFLLLCLLLLTSCEHSRDANAEQEERATYSGILKYVYLPKDERCHAISADGRLIVLRGTYARIDEYLIGKKITVTGVLKQQQLPIFILDERSAREGDVPQGIPVPPGTDLGKKSIYYVIQNPEWKVKD